MNEKQIEKLFKRKDKFILDENKNVIPATLLEWGEFLETHRKERIVGQLDLNGKWISTVFLGLNHSYNLHELHIFETIVFNRRGKGRSEIYCDRYPTWKEAVKGHKKAIQWVKDGCKDDE